MAAGQYLYQGMSDFGAGVAKRASRIEEQEKDLKRAKATLKFLEAQGHDTSGLQDVDSEGLNSVAELLMKGGEMKLRQDALDSEMKYRQMQIDEANRKREASDTFAGIVSSKVPVEQVKYDTVLQFGSVPRTQYGYEQDIPLEVLSQAPQAQTPVTDVLAQQRNPLITPEISNLKTDEEKINALSKNIKEQKKQYWKDLSSKINRKRDEVVGNVVDWLSKDPDKEEALNILVSSGEIKSSKQDEVPELLARPQQATASVQKPVPQYNIKPDYATGANMLPKTQFKTTQAPTGKETVMVNAVEAAGGLNNLIQSNPEVAKAWATMDKDQREAFTDTLGGGSAKDQLEIAKLGLQIQGEQQSILNKQLEYNKTSQEIQSKGVELSQKEQESLMKKSSAAALIGSTDSLLSKLEKGADAFGPLEGSLVGQTWKSLKAVLGDDEGRRLQKEFQRIIRGINLEDAQALTGQMSDNDIKFIKEKVVDITDSPEDIYNFLKEYRDRMALAFDKDEFIASIPDPTERAKASKSLKNLDRNAFDSVSKGFNSSGSQSYKTKSGSTFRIEQ